jgi:hypothetical protein
MVPFNCRGFTQGRGGGDDHERWRSKYAESGGSLTESMQFVGLKRTTEKFTLDICNPAEIRTSIIPNSRLQRCRCKSESHTINNPQFSNGAFIFVFWEGVPICERNVPSQIPGSKNLSTKTLFYMTFLFFISASVLMYLFISGGYKPEVCRFDFRWSHGIFFFPIDALWPCGRLSL